jgi:hypothetical protein
MARLYNALLPALSSGFQRHSRGRNSSAALRLIRVKKNFQNAIRLLTWTDRHFYNRDQLVVVVEVVVDALGEWESQQLRLHSSQGGCYGNKESWQDQEESSCEEESCRQEEEVSSTTSSEAVF